ncbi:MAG: DUF2332 domain-containing protein [Actinobacteria bacterium]|nr:DUF2332 domain-containing protein [Actinomycetota bacterium]
MGTARLSGGRETLASTFRRQGRGGTVLGSPLTAQLCNRMAEDVEAGGPTWSLLEPYARAPLNDAYPIRVLGGAHRLALVGDAPDYARHLPSTGGDGDLDAAWLALRALFESAPPALCDALSRPPQTNEVGRSASLIGGFLMIASQIQRPVRALEIGASAGLNLRFDHFRYQQNDRGFGPSNSAVRFAGLWSEAEPPFGAPLTVAERRGCDLDPVDIAAEEGRLTLLSYVWADQLERFDLLSAALEIAAHVPVKVDRADAGDWLGDHLGQSMPGVTTVVFHSVMWQYLSAEQQSRIRDLIVRAGDRASDDAPLAWLRLEPEGDLAYPRLRLSTWPGEQERHLANCSFHLGPIEWLV